MSGPPILYDASRLSARVLTTTPNGIDRLDALLARALLAGEGAAALGLGWGGPRLWPARAGLDALDRAEALWREQAVTAGSALDAVAARLAGRRPAPPRRAVPPGARVVAVLAALRQFGLGRGQDPATAAPRGAVTLNASHFPLERHRHTAWLDRRRDVRAVMLVHDLLPLDRPDWFWRGEAERHARRLAWLAARGSAAIVTSGAVEARLRDALARAGRRDMPVFRSAPPVSRIFREPPARDPRLAGLRYFVACGTVEPRKNHRLLAAVWRRLAADAPKLVVVGRRGWQCRDILAELAPLAAAGRIVMAEGLSSRDYKALLDASLGLLAPSRAEGFGLPVAEALAAGVPVVASDIAPFREQAEGAALLLDPDDAEAWHDALLTLAEPAGQAAARRRGVAHAPVEEAAYLDALRAFLAGV